jgi:hypothetical protein
MINIGQRWKYQNKNDSFICEVIGGSQYRIIQYLYGIRWAVGDVWDCPDTMYEPTKNWIYLEGQDKPI